MAGGKKREQEVLLVAYIDLDRGSDPAMDAEDIVDERLDALRETEDLEGRYGIFLFRARPEDLSEFSLEAEPLIPSIPLRESER